MKRLARRMKKLFLDFEHEAVGSLILVGNDLPHSQISLFISRGLNLGGAQVHNYLTIYEVRTKRGFIYPLQAALDRLRNACHFLVLESS